MDNNELRKEAEILSERITVLREQETRYTDLSKEIAGKKEEMIRLDEAKDKTNREIEVKRTEVLNQERKKGIALKDTKDAEAELDKLRLKIEREGYVHEDKKKECEASVAQMDAKIERTRKLLDDYAEKLKRATGEYQKSMQAIKEDKKNTLEEIEANKSILDKQNEDIEAQRAKYEQIQKDYDELNGEYTKLLENYITKT